MDFPPYYTALYCFIYTKDIVPVGAGLCIDGRQVITCAHVVNAAGGKAINSLQPPPDNVIVSFPLNEQLSARYFPAKISVWCWNDSLLQNALPFQRQSILIRNDLAVLQLTIDEEATQMLSPYSDQLVFLKGNMKNGRYDAFCQLPEQPGTIVEIGGPLGTNEIVSGSTILMADVNQNNFFFDHGSSGSPVFCSVQLHPNYPTPVGIGGYIDYLNQTEKGRDARMIHFDTLQQLLDKHQSGIRLRYVDLDKRRSTIASELASKKILAERGKEVYCDRNEVIDKIMNRSIQPVTPLTSFLIIGNERQKLDAFIDRYRLEFIAGKGMDSTLIYFKMPAETDIRLFCHKLIGAILRAFQTPYKKLSVDNPGQLTIQHIADELLLDDNSCYVFDCRMEDEDFSLQQTFAYQWFIGQFLEPLRQDPRLASRLHLFLSFYYRPGADCNAKIQFLITSLNNIDLPELTNVTKQEVKEWLDIVEAEDIVTRNQIISYFHWQESYDMKEVMDYYKEALEKADKF